jgi:hypothetical protein
MPSQLILKEDLPSCSAKVDEADFDEVVEKVRPRGEVGE